MAVVYLGIGSNVGDKEGNIRSALRMIGDVCALMRVSRLYKSAPVGFLDQDWFINCAAQADCDMAPTPLLRSLKSIETRLGRVETVKMGPRVIDLDILFYADEVVEEPLLRIPHPRLHERLFVLAPLMDLNPDLIHPITGRTVRQMYADRERDGGVEPV
jgi:2-amino-4-hydroxy-6-hydroxymethyldihydropteridine diphosphokinase